MQVIVNKEQNNLVLVVVGFFSVLFCFLQKMYEYGLE